nr:TonB-dependent receptor plug domain-containing protein [Pseudomonas sp.]
MQVSSTRATKKAQLLFRTATAALGISLLAGAAHAQADGQGGTFNPGSEFVADDVIIVTGSRIARPNVEANIPVAVIGNVQLQEDAATNVQDILNEMPQVGIGTSRTNSNFLTGANGVATVDLRNMGEDRTLVLINGRR